MYPVLIYKGACLFNVYWRMQEFSVEIKNDNESMAKIYQIPWKFAVFK